MATDGSSIDRGSTQTGTPGSSFKDSELGTFRRQANLRGASAANDANYRDAQHLNTLKTIKDANKRTSLHHARDGGIIGEFFTDVANGTVLDFSARQNGSMFHIGEWFEGMAQELPGEMRREHG